VADGCGTLSTNTVLLSGKNFRHAGAGAQPGGIGTAGAGGVSNYAGFLHAADIKRPQADADRDGVPDELETDNDADTLSDLAELDRSAFRGHAATDPNRADSDGDGMDDGAEAGGMYDPWDPNHRLEILALTRASGQYTVRWIGKGGGTTNTVYAANRMVDGGFTNVLQRAAYAGGVDPWFKATNTYTWAEAATQRFLRVQTGP
jgi:hypothetical protein